MRGLVAQVEDLTRKNHELEWTTISLCRRTMSLSHRIGSREDQRHMPYLRARAYGNVLQRQGGRRGSGAPKHRHPEVPGSEVELSYYRSDNE